ncbi:MAG TPA: hypothetical protein VMF70_11630 [Gemmatimonadales bacterium]|nr:hypothetical protein [Gemmatimonadales bacterium]
MDLDARYAAAGLVGLLLVGCSTDKITRVAPTVTAAADAWSGGIVLLGSRSFTGPDSVPVVTVGNDTLVVQRRGVDSVLVQLPDTDGAISLVVRLRAGGHANVLVSVHGFASVRPGPPLEVNAQLYPWPDAGNPTALAIQDGRLVLLNLASLTVSAPLAPDTGLFCHTTDYGSFAPVPSATVPGLVTALTSCPGGAGYGRVLAVPISPAAAPPDTSPLTAAEVGVHLSRGKWLVSNGHAGLVVYARTDSVTFSQTAPNGFEAFGAVVSPRGDRVVPTFTLCGTVTGLPVYDAAGAVAYRIANIPCASGPATFTEAGDTLYVSGVDSLYAEVLLAVDATTGSILARAIRSPDTLYIRASPTAGLAADPLRPFLYAAGWRDGPVLDVLDRGTLQSVASLRPPASVTAGLDSRANPLMGYPWTIVMNPIARRLYVVPTNKSATPEPYVFEYELMP